MRARPAWLALGIIVAAGSVSYAPLAGDSVAAVAVAVALSVVLAMAALVAMAGGRRGPGASLAVASVGAAMVAARLSIGIAVGGGIGPGSGGAATPLPQGTGPWSARVESAHITNALQIATLSLSGSRLECSAQLPVWPQLISGDVISWTGRVRALGDGDYDRYLAGRGIAATCEATSMALVSHDETLNGQLEALRQATGDGLQKVLPEPEGGLATAILVGLRDRVDRDLAAAFTTAGISHIVAISGWNIAIVAACVAALLRGLVGRRRRTIVTLAAIVAYTVFAGASPSVVRAAFMAAVAMLALESGRGSRVMVSLAWAVSIMLLADPTTAADVGFQLSAAATAGLVAWGTPLTQRIEAWLPWLPAGLRETLGVSLAAQAATLPIALATFGRLSLIAPVANLVAVPLVPPAMAAGAVAFVAGWLALAGAPAWLTGLLALPAHFILAALVGVVRIMAAVPGASATLPFPANALGATAAVGLAFVLHRALSAPGASAAGGPGSPVGGEGRRSAGSHFGGRALRPVLVGLAFFVVAAGSVVEAAPDGAVHVIVLDVGQGDAILLEGDRGSRILVDGGPDANVLLTQLDRYIPAWDRRLDAIVLTHPHEDHVGGLVAVVQRYSVGRAFESGWPSSMPGYLAWKSALAAAGVKAERLSTGRRIGLDDASLDVLWPDDGRVRPSGLDPGATDNRMTNDSSIVLLGDYEGRRFLLTGDAEDDVDPILLARGLPHVDMLKVAHHGSATATSAALLDALEPSVAAISVGANNTYGHPNAGTLTRLRAHSQSVHRTDQEGTIEVTLDRSAVTVETDRSADAARVTSPVVAATGLGPITTTTAAIAWVARGQRAAPGLLYDAGNVRAKPSRSRCHPSLSRAARVASSPFPRRGRDSRVVGAAGGLRGASPRSPPCGGGRSSP